jgi:serine/threonine-protein kinase HipA
MHSLCGLIHSDYRFPSLDYSDLLKVTQVLTKDMREVEAAFRLACFNVIMHNRDDHSKNFSFLYIDKEWKLSPAYDLTFSSGPNGYQSMTVAGESLKPTLSHLKELGTKANIKKPERIIDQVITSTMKWKDTASGLNISDSTIKTISQIIDSHVKAG